ncbi:Hypothetical protein I5071_64070 [Sandaracinus amylolyticus]|nr:hypothetical protein [Sandaracinus amylolyticus]UJR84329.1 Hypothetical protein I5071_64070 [Sandaracinus amylolyticus]
MVIVVLILITAALAAPGLMRSMAVNRAQRATHDAARLARQARSDSISYGRAYLMIHSAGTSSRGRLELWRGLTDTCRSNDWSTIVVANGCTASPRAVDCVDAVDFSDYSTAGHTVQITTSGTTTHVCFEPDDEIWVSTGGGTFSRPAQALRFPINRLEGSTALEQRGLFVPISGAPRVF